MVREGFLGAASEGDLRGEGAVQAGRLSRLKPTGRRGLGMVKGQRGGRRGCSLMDGGRQGHEEGAGLGRGGGGFTFYSLIDSKICKGRSGSLDPSFWGSRAEERGVFKRRYS